MPCTSSVAGWKPISKATKRNMKSFSDAVLEGLIHNLRNPLNLVVGYAQKLDNQNISDYKAKIYQAGIKMDDLMQNTWDALQYRKCGEGSTDLNEWLSYEMILMGNHLQLKHRILFETDISDKPHICNLPPLKLSQWLEDLIDQLLNQLPEGLISMHLTVAESIGLIIRVNISDNLVSLHELSLVQTETVPLRISKDAQNTLTITARLL